MVCVYRALLKSAVPGTCLRIHATKKMVCEVDKKWNEQAFTIDHGASTYPSGTLAKS